MGCSNAPAPEYWPYNVRKISIDGLHKIRIDPTTNELFWDGQKLVTERRLASFERWLAFLATSATCVCAG